MSIALAVFDMAGTTIVDQDDVAKAFQQAFKKNHLEVSMEEINPLMGYHKPSAIQMVLQRKNAIYNHDLIGQIHEEFLDQMIEFYTYSPEVMAMPFAEQAFLFLKGRGIKVTLNTGFSRDIADIIMKRMQWVERGLVDDYIASDEVEAGRPFPFMINKLTLRNNVPEGSEIMKIGDTIVDIQEGKNAGCKYVIAVVTGSASRSELEPYSPTHIIDSLSEIQSIFKSELQFHE